GFMAGARAARTAASWDVTNLVARVHETARLWGATTPAEGLAEPLSAFVEAATRCDTAPRPGADADPWPETVRPARGLDEHFRTLAGDGRSQWRVGAARDCVGLLLGEPRPVERCLLMPVLTFSAAGCVLRLGAELLRDGTGDCYPDPQRMGLLPMTRSFLDAA